MVNRKHYFEKLLNLKDKQIIKVVTGVRRCGKSTLLEQFKLYLLKKEVDKNQIISINFEDVAYEHLLDYKVLYEYLRENLHSSKKTYIFLDEIQEVKNFQKVVDSLFLDPNVDIYITGSNAHMLSGELATLLSGRYIEIKMLPLSFKEYNELMGGNIKDNFNKYFINGGFPYTTQLYEANVIKDYIDSIYNSIVIKDIVTRKKITDVALLKSITKFIADRIGNILSSKKIADYLTSSGRKTSHLTIENYIEALSESFIVYSVDRYDIKGKQLLKTLNKYYLVDQGLRRLILGDKKNDIGFVLENIVYLELIRRGYEVYIGKIGDLEVDFIAENGDDKMYIQVSATVLDPNTFTREISPLEKIKDNYPKYIVTMDELPMNKDGIKQINIIDFLMNE
ncbi:MAG: ATP-binding protein [Anaeroplasma sp.]